MPNETYIDEGYVDELYDHLVETYDGMIVNGSPQEGEAMMLITQEIREKLLANDQVNDPYPVVRLFTPAGRATWLLCSIDPENEDMAFGLCDLGMGSPELGYVSMEELRTVRDGMGLHVERDRYFRAKKRISEYAEEARSRQGICA